MKFSDFKRKKYLPRQQAKMDSSGPNLKVKTLSDEETSSLECMPNEILIHILSFLDTRFVLEVVSLVSLRLQNLIADDSLWKIRTKRRLAKNRSGHLGIFNVFFLVLWGNDLFA